MSIRQLCLSLREWVYHEEMNLIRDEEQHIEAKIENLKLDMEHFKIVQYKLEAFESLLDIITEPPGAHTLRMPTDEKLRSTTFPGFANTEHLNQELEEIINNLMCHQQSVLNDDVYQKTMLTEAMQIVELLKEKIDTNFKQLLGEHNLKICNEIDELMHLCGTSCKQVDEMYYTFGTHMISRIVEGLDHQQVALKQLTMDIVDLNLTLDVNTLQICPMSWDIYSGLGADNLNFQTVKEKDLRDGDPGYRDIDRFEKELKNVSQMRGTFSENVNQMKDRLLEDKTVLTGVHNQLKKFISVACTIINCLRQPFGATMAPDPQSKQNPVQFEVIYDRIESTRQQQLPFSVSQSLLETTDTRERKQNQVELKFANINTI
ncbi:uncharacterized protein LOC127835531 [Dreissena polymorpha]|uniref:uncharacterized protein LOC127835531 n=1 Tax=Dreissena polymorpha TaxID=45954 RepID=UPI0022650DBC|nr:uncharacterized protein LOC127835531 [Dreissena polymorpha]